MVVSVESAALKVIDGVPELRELWCAHVEYYEEGLPYVFFGDVVRWLEVQPSETLVMELMERARSVYINGDSHSRNFVLAAFVENIDHGSWLVELLPSPLREARNRMRLD